MKKIALLGATIVSAGILTASASSIASAATNNTTQTGNVGSSSIPRDVFRQERLDAEAKVLNTTTDNIEAAHKNHTFKQLLSQAGLTHKTFMQKMKDQLTSDLEAKGYSQEQITIALQHKEIVRLHHKAKKGEGANNKNEANNKEQKES